MNTFLKFISLYSILLYIHLVIITITAKITAHFPSLFPAALTQSVVGNNSQYINIVSPLLSTASLNPPHAPFTVL